MKTCHLCHYLSTKSLGSRRNVTQHPCNCLSCISTASCLTPSSGAYRNWFAFFPIYVSPSSFWWKQDQCLFKCNRRSVLGVHWKDWFWSWNSNTWPPDAKSWLIWKDPDAGKDWGQEEKGMTEDEMVGWHHRLNRHGFGWTPGVGDGQGGLACCGSWGRKESDTTEWLNWTEPLPYSGYPLWQT